MGALMMIMIKAIFCPFGYTGKKDMSHLYAAEMCKIQSGFFRNETERKSTIMV